MTISLLRWPRLLAGCCLAFGLFLVASSALAQGGELTAGGYYYVVQRGDTWWRVAARTGVTAAELQAANPAAMHPNGWLWLGERLFIPERGHAPSVAASAGSWYRVKSGDTWQLIAQQTGASVSELLRANPMYVRPKYLLYVGDTLRVPGFAAQPAVSSIETPEIAEAPVEMPPAPPLPETAPTWPEPEPTAAASPAPLPAPGARVVPAATAAASPALPLPPATPTAPAMPAAPATATHTPPTATVTASRAAPLPSATAAVPVAPAVAGTAAATRAAVAPSATPPAACPSSLAGYVEAIAARLGGSSASADTLRLWLTNCGVLQERHGGVFQAALQGAASRDIVVVLDSPASDGAAPPSAMLVYHGAAPDPLVAGPAAAQGRYTMVRRVDGAGILTLLRAGDVNADGRGDLVWTDATCGAHTCFSTLFVESWDGVAYGSWIEGHPTMASGEYTLRDVLPGGSGEEIMAYGGVIGSAGAGPQRAWTETYVSPEGGPYRLFGTVYDASPCLYHRILDANRAFDDAPTSGFAPAIAAYKSATEDRDAQACGSIPGELAVLRDFARFRLVVAFVASGRAGQAREIQPQISQAALSGAARLFLERYGASGSIVQACRDTAGYAEANPDSWQILSDWGYANPGFTASDLCPLD